MGYREIQAKALRPLAFAALAAVTVLGSAAGATERPARHAGTFYEGDPAALSAEVDARLSYSGSPSVVPPAALIVPHAGFVYSGDTAALAYALLDPAYVDTVVLVGPSHRVPLNGASVWKGGDWVTPLGRVKVDRTLAAAIAGENSAFQASDEAHAEEHSLENQLPFLQRRLGKDMRIVPILVNDTSEDLVYALAAAVAKHTAKRHSVLVASTDMTHFKPAGEAEFADRAVLELYTYGDPGALKQHLDAGLGELCGQAAAQVAMEYAKLKGQTFRVVGYATSARASQDFSSVVGYGAAASGPPKLVLSDAARAALVAAAWEGVRSAVTESDIMPSVPEGALAEPAAVFVTLEKNGELRGCVGGIFAEKPLLEAVTLAGAAAATRDTRFQPVSPDELGALTVKVSVLSPMRRVRDASEIRIPGHGVYLKRGAAEGVFLPQVAGETGWDKERFLDELATQKAGLRPGAWKDPKTELYVFTVDEFGE